jgi:Kef-type K+ transport system membrane component KefB
MRRVSILLLLLGGMHLIGPIGTAPGGAPRQALLTFGFLILAAYTVGEIMMGIGLPKIVGYLAAGILFGPSGLGTVTREAIYRLSPINGLAIAIIAFLAGAELDWRELKQRGTTILKMLGVELTLSFAAIFVLLYAVRGWVPFLRDIPAIEAASFSALFASVAVIHSPAVTLALLTETGARGPVARTTLAIVLIADVAVLLLFTGVLAVTRAIAPPGGEGHGPSLGVVGWEIGGSLLVGVLIGGAVALFVRYIRGELLMFALVVAFLGAEIARLAHVETLLTLLVAGFVTENGLGARGLEFRHAMERSAAPVFVVFFALSGAYIAVREVALLWPVVIPLVLVRMVAIWGGTALGARWAGATADERRYVWLGLISQAGVAIGLATVVSEVYPERGAQLRTLFLAVLAINQVLGPILFRRALVQAKEIQPAGVAA